MSVRVRMPSVLWASSVMGMQPMPRDGIKSAVSRIPAVRKQVITV